MSEIHVRFLDEDYSFPHGLKEYGKLYNYFDETRQRLLAIFLDSIKKQDDPKTETLVTINKQFEEEGKKALSMLFDANIFDVTIGDLVQNNNGYVSFQNAALEANNQLLEILRRAMENFLSGMEDAQNRALSNNVTGSGTMLISNSVVSHLAFGAMEISRYNNQLSKADAEYRSLMSDLSNENQSKQDKETNAYFLNVWYPSGNEAITQFSFEMLSKYIDALIANGKINKDALDYVNVVRANDLLKKPYH